MLTMNSAAQPVPASTRAPGRLVALTASLELPGFTMSFDRDEDIFGEGESADFIYRVVSGAVRISRLIDDGRRQISAFYLPGDVFGLEMDEAHSASAEAVTDCEIALVKRVAVQRAVAQDPSTAGKLWSLTSEQLRFTQDHLVMLGRRSATEKVGRFLLSMAGRASSGDTVSLAMSRLDIADYLGLTIETVSRTFTHLERQGAIGLNGAREVVFRNRAAL